MSSKAPPVTYVRLRSLQPGKGTRVIDGLYLKEWDGNAWVILGVANGRDFWLYPLVAD